VQEGIHDMLLLFVDLLVARLQYDPLPVNMLNILSTVSSDRHVYLSLSDSLLRRLLSSACSEWFPTNDDTLELAHMVLRMLFRYFVSLSGLVDFAVKASLFRHLKSEPSNASQIGSCRSFFDVRQS